MKQVKMTSNGALSYNEEGVPNLRTHKINREYTSSVTTTKEIPNKYLYEIFDIGDSKVGFEVGELVDARMVQLVNDALKIDGKCLVKVHQHTCGRYPQNRTNRWGYCYQPQHFWNVPSCNERHSNDEVTK